jgi:phage terminase small subunit
MGLIRMDDGIKAKEVLAEAARRMNARKHEKLAEQRIAERRKRDRIRQQKKRQKKAAQPKALNAKHARFVQEYLKDLSPSNAALRAGYSNRYHGDNLLLRKDVAAAVAKRQREIAERATITTVEVVERLAKVVRSNILDYCEVDEDGLLRPDFSRMSHAQAEAIAEVITEVISSGEEGGPKVTKIRFKLHDKLEAADKLLRHLGGYVDRREVHVTHSFKDLSDEELDRRIAESARVLGYSVPGPVLIEGTAEKESVVEELPALPLRTNGHDPS